MELTEDQQKGLDMMVKVLNKKYPYIIGVSPNMKDFETYSAIFTVKLIMSKTKLEDYFKKGVDNDWGEFWRFSNIIYPNPDPESLITEEIKSLGAMFYKTLTDEYKFKSELSTPGFRRVKINSFILDDTD